MHSVITQSEFYYIDGHVISSYFQPPLDRTDEIIEQGGKLVQSAFKMFVTEVSKLLKNKGIPVDTINFVNAIDVKLSRFDRHRVVFFTEYPQEVKERILDLIQAKYQELLENPLGSFMRIYSQLYQQKMSQLYQQNTQLTITSAPHTTNK